MPRLAGAALPGVPLEEVASNADAAEHWRRATRGTAAIAGAARRRALRLKMVAASIQDLPNNVTRFLVLGRDGDGRPTGDDKTSMLLRRAARGRGAVPRARAVRRQRINLSTIESRPLKGRAWEYVFFLDLAGHADEPRMARALAALQAAGAVRQGAGLVPGLALAGRRGATMNVKNLVPPWMHSLEPYPPGKPIDELEREYGIIGSIKLASNENPLGPSPKALAAMRAALAEVHRYPDGNCFHLQAGAGASKLGLSPEALIFGNGSNEIIELAVRTFLHAGEEAVMADQAFVIYRMLVQAQGGTRRSSCRCATSPTTSRRWPRPITPATRMVFLANPNNPTGTIFFRDQWEEFLAARAARTSWSSWTRPTPSSSRTRGIPTRSPTCGASSLLIVLRTFSKIYGLAGLRVGYGVAHPELIEVHEPRAGAVQRQQPGAGGGAGGARRRRARRAHARSAIARAWPICARRSRASASSTCRAGPTSCSSGSATRARVYDALLRHGVIVRPVPVYGFPEHVRVTVGTRGGERTPGRGARARLLREEGRLALLFERAAIVGVGLIGGSLALAARAAGLIGEVVGVGRSAGQPGHRAASAASSTATTRDPARRSGRSTSSCSRCRCAAPRRWRARLLPHLRPGTVVTDVGSVKGDGAWSVEARAAGGPPVRRRAIRSPAASGPARRPPTRPVPRRAAAS